MKATPKNSTKGYTSNWINERNRLTEFYQKTPFYGSQLSEKLFTLVKTTIPSLIQVSHCGPVIQITTYKQDADKAQSILYGMFKRTVNQKTCPYTAYVTTYVINKPNN